MDLHVVPLVDYKDILPVIAGWYFSAFGKEGTTFELCKKKLLGRLNTEALDICYVAFEGNEPIGTVSLTQNDIPTASNLTPCIANVFVIPKHRHKNIGRKLVEHAKLKLKAMNFHKAYLYTTNKTIHQWYQKLGWEIISEGKIYNFDIKIMECEL